MSRIYRSLPCLASCLALTAFVAAGGCCTTQQQQQQQLHLPMQDTMPRELSKVILPSYTIEPPDLLMIDQVYLVPKEGYELRPRDVVRITAHRGPGDTLKEGDQVYVEVQGVPLKARAFELRPGDALQIHAAGVVPQPIVDAFQVDDNGEIQLRVPETTEKRDALGNVTGTELVAVHDYGTVRVAGMSVKDAEDAIQKHLAQRFPEATVVALLLQEPQTPILGNFVVHQRADGEDEIILPPPYGRVTVTGMSAAGAEQAIAARAQTAMYQVAVRVALVNATPINSSYWVELDGSIDLDNPVGFARTAGEGIVAGQGAGTLYNVMAGPPQSQPGRRMPILDGMQGGAVPLLETGDTEKTVLFRRVDDVRGKTVDEVKESITRHLLHYFKDIEVAMSIEQVAAQQQVMGQHLVGPDGTVTLGTYGSVPVVGLTLAQAKTVVEHHLSQFFQTPEISVDVFAYNSKVYYVITQGAGLGDGVTRFPITGNETVLDAISQVGGLDQVASKRIWIARPTPNPDEVQVLPVSWEAITARASASTNYQILPGDRLFIAEDKLIAFDTGLSKLLAPVERIMNFSTQGVGTVTRFSGPVLRGGGARGSGYWGGSY
ncbi:MAG TPA: polysaccharide biosynthesis/export family protein [Thermoguttaceae bacterium]|nr:polysaccharide biosynthesis/export family protein [Thermoguttaceae bacterium]